MFTKPEVRTEMIIPAQIPPVVSIEKDFPGTNPFSCLADDNNLTNANPEIRQKGKSKRRVKIRLLRNEGVSPVSRNSLEKRSIRKIETSGLNEKIRLILRISFRADLPANKAPAADVISQEPRKMPVISSYPPEIFNTSLIKRICTDVPANPITKRFGTIEVVLAN